MRTVQKSTKKWFTSSDGRAGVLVNDTAHSTRGMGLDSRAAQIVRRVANGSPPWRRFCVAQELSRVDDLLHALA